MRMSDEASAASPKPRDQKLNSSGTATGQIISSNTSNTANATNRVHRESRLLTTKQPTSGTSVSTGKERLRGTSVSSNESIGEIPTRRSVRQNTASPLATPAGNTRGASRSVDDVNRRKTRSGAAHALIRARSFEQISSAFYDKRHKLMSVEGVLFTGK
ncbi:uncharacterized protein LOC105686833 isoform X4 [Athalia rosae]|nr:uncharacterized protein LOC105686833 isoform X4 [Athalia rosae]